MRQGKGQAGVFPKCAAYSPDPNIYIAMSRQACQPWAIKVMADYARVTACGICPRAQAGTRALRIGRVAMRARPTGQVNGRCAMQTRGSLMYEGPRHARGQHEHSAVVAGRLARNAASPRHQRMYAVLYTSHLGWCTLHILHGCNAQIKCCHYTNTSRRRVISACRVLGCSSLLPAWSNARRSYRSTCLPSSCTRCTCTLLHAAACSAHGVGCPSAPASPPFSSTPSHSKSLQSCPPPAPTSFYVSTTLTVAVWRVTPYIHNPTMTPQAVPD